MEIDFDRCRDVVERRLGEFAGAGANGIGSAVWSSRTESLLAVDLGDALQRE